MYYIKKDSKIIFYDHDLETLKNVLLFRPDLSLEDIKETDKEIVDGVFTDSEEYFTNSKANKLNELNNTFQQYIALSNRELLITSTLGYVINADICSQNNLRGLIEVGIDPVDYVLADNTSVSLNIDQLKILLNDCMLNMQYLYQQKWDYRNKIDEAETLDDLNAIEIKFEMKNFNDA